MSIVKAYLQEIWRGFGYHGAWLPNSQMKLGEVGRLVNERFEPVTSLQALGIASVTAPAGRVVDLEWASAGTSHVTTRAGADVAAAAQGRMQIKLGRAGGVLFVAKQCRTARLDNLDALGRTLHERSILGQWEKDYHVVTEVVTTGPVTILVSSTQSCSIDLTARVPLSGMGSLANIDAGLSIEQGSELAAVVLGQAGLTPLFRLRALQSRVFRTPVLTTRSSHQPSELEIVEVDLMDAST